MGEKQNQPFQLSFNASLKVDFQGSRVTSDGGLILVRELDERLGLEKLIGEHLSDSRQGLNKQFTLADLLRQSVYSRLAGYEDLNDAERLAADPTFRLISSQKLWDRGAALTSTLHWFETELLTQEENLIGLMALNRDMIGQAETFDRSDRVVLDMDSSESPVHGEQEGSAYNGHFESVCYHPLFLFNDHGDCLAAKLRSGNVSQRRRLGRIAPAGDRPPAGRGQAGRVPGRRRLCEAGDLRGAGGARRDVRHPHPGQQEPGAGDRGIAVSVPGRPSHKPLVRYKSFLYQADSWTTARRVVAKVEYHVGELFPRVGFIVTNLSLPESGRRAVLQQAGHRRAMDQGRKAGGALDPAIVSSIPGERSPLAVERARLQLGQPVASAGAAKANRYLVADQLAAAPRQDGRAAGQARQVLLAPAGGEPPDPTPVRSDAPADLGTTDRNGLRRGACNKAAGRRKRGSGFREMPRNGGSSRLQVSANQADGPPRAARNQFASLGRACGFIRGPFGRSKWKYRVICARTSVQIGNSKSYG